jgi:protein CpxP
MMKRSHDRFTYAAARAIVAGALVTFVALASGPIFAAQASGQDRVEARIQDMHAKLSITAAQEDQWKQVAQVMRDNQNAIEPLVQGRTTKAKTMSAVDDLRSYAQIADAHAEGIKKFTTAFEPLYAGMSDAQKKEADALFRDGIRKITKSK